MDQKDRLSEGHGAEKGEREEGGDEVWQEGEVFMSAQKELMESPHTALMRHRHR